MSKDSGDPEEGCLLCPGRTKIADAHVRAMLAAVAAELLEPNNLYEIENREVRYELASQTAANAAADEQKERDRMRRAFTTCVGPRILQVVANDMRITVSVCTSPDAYKTTRARCAS